MTIVCEPPTRALSIVVKRLGRVPYAESLTAMRRFTSERTDTTLDELWVLEHPPVYTNGQAGRPEHFPTNAADTTIPLVQVDRGGQVTYHGPGQIVIYTLIDLPRRGLGVRALVARLEDAVIALIADYNLVATRRGGAPGVYVGD